MKKSSVIRTSSTLSRYDAESSVRNLYCDYLSIWKIKFNVCIADQSVERIREGMAVIPQYHGLIRVIYLQLHSMLMLF